MAIVSGVRTLNFLINGTLGSSITTISVFFFFVGRLAITFGWEMTVLPKVQ